MSGKSFTGLAGGDAPAGRGEFVLYKIREDRRVEAIESILNAGYRYWNIGKHFAVMEMPRGDGWRSPFPDDLLVVWYIVGMVYVEMTGDEFLAGAGVGSIIRPIVEPRDDGSDYDVLGFEFLMDDGSVLDAHSSGYFKFDPARFPAKFFKALAGLLEKQM